MTSSNLVRRNWGALHSTNNSGSNFQKFPLANGIAFPGIFRKGKTLRGMPNVRKFITRNFLSRDLYNLRRNFLHFGNSTIFGFSGNFPRTFSYHLPAFRMFKKFWLSGKRPGSGQKLDVLKMWPENKQIRIAPRIKLANPGSLSLS